MFAAVSQRRAACGFLALLLVAALVLLAPADCRAQEGDSSNTPPEGRTLLDTLLAGGVVALLIVLLSLVMVAFVIEHLLSIRKGKLMPDRVLSELEEQIARGEVDEAIEFCYRPENRCLASECVLAGLERYQSSDFGFAEYKAAVEEAGEDQTGRLYRKTEVLGVIGSIAPMLGLTGTVLGMINSFNTIASEGGMASPDKLAGGISQALVTTLLGLLVAMPAMIAFAYFRNSIDSIVAEAGKRVERVLAPLARKRWAS